MIPGKKLRREERRDVTSCCHGDAASRDVTTAARAHTAAFGTLPVSTTTEQRKSTFPTALSQPTLETQWSRGVRLHLAVKGKVPGPLHVTHGKIDVHVKWTRALCLSSRCLSLSRVRTRSVRVPFCLPRPAPPRPVLPGPWAVRF